MLSKFKIAIHTIKIPAFSNLFINILCNYLAMKLSTIIILLSCFNYLVYTQNTTGLVTYKQIFEVNQNIPDSVYSIIMLDRKSSTVNPSFLLFNDYASVYMYGSKKIPNTKTKFDNTGEVIYKNILTKEMVHRDGVFLLGLAIIEENGDKFPKFNWSITTETRRLGSFTCYKATCYFRGRHWEAWFCPDIPIKMGPWKFYGLPGLILEVYDKDKKINFLFEEIEIPATNKLILEDIGLEIKPYRDGKLNATWEDYKDYYRTLTQKKIDEYTKQLNAEYQSRGNSFRMIKMGAVCEEPQIELEFEY